MNGRRVFSWLALVLCAAAGMAQAPPSLNQQYRGHGISFSYPYGWQVQESSTGIVVAPPDARRVLKDGREWISLGIIVAFYQSSTADAATARNELVTRLRQFNPELRQIGQPRALNIAGNASFVTDFANSARSDGIFSRDVLLTVKVPDGAWFWMLGCPAEQTSTYLPLFGSIIQTIQFGGPTSSAVAQPLASAAYIEPSRTVVREIVDVRAGYTQHYSFPLARGSKLVAQFHVQGGLNNKVDILLLDSANYLRYSSRQQFSYFRGTSGMVRDVGSYEFTVPASDNYHLLIDNGKAWFMPRKVKIYAYELLSEPTQELRALETRLDQFYGMMKAFFVFPDFRISIRHCGLENAFSNPNITLCEELLEDLGDHHHESAIAFVLFHELGHTLLRGWGLPGYDNEDTADEFATVMMMMGHQQSAALQAAEWWASRTSTQEALSKIYVDDRHTISPQRARNIIRWLNSGEDLIKRWQRLMVPNMQTAQLQRELGTSEIDRELVLGELRKRGVAGP